MTRLMRAIANQTGSFGVILWRKRRDQGELAMRAVWFDTGRGPSGRYLLSKLSVSGTWEGRALEEGQSINNDLERYHNENAKNPFLVRHGVNKVLSCKLPDGSFDGLGDVLSLYRRGRRSDAPSENQIEERDFDEATLLYRLVRICEVVPRLFAATRDQDALRLLERTATVLRDYKPAVDTHSWRSKLEEMVERFCLVVKDGFRALEVSVFLRDEIDPKTFRCLYTTPGPHEKSVRAKTYRKGEMRGFSGLALQTGLFVRIRDVKDAEKEQVDYKSRFPAYTPHETEGISTVVDQHYKFLKGEEPPHSLMVARLASGDDNEVYGFIRCWMAMDGPPSYSQHDADLLLRVANRLSQALEATMDEHQRDLAVAAASDYMGKRSASGDLFVDALTLVGQAVQGAEVNTVRLYDERTQELYFYTYPTGEAVGWSAQEAEAKLKTRFPVRKRSSPSIGSEVFLNKRAEQRRTHDPRYDHLFPGIREIIVAPIVHDDRAYGVIDVRTRTHFRPGARHFVELIGRLVGTQHARLLAEAKARAAEKCSEEEKMRAVQEEQRHLRLDIEKERRAIEAFEDSGHQLKTPLSNALKALERWAMFGHDARLSQLETMLRRADLASKLINTFADLAAGKTLSLKGPHDKGLEGEQEMTKDGIYRMAEMLCQDVRLYSNREKRLTVDLDEKSFDKHCPAIVRANENLLTQALYNLLDNAEKYSFKGSTIRCFADTTGTGRFCLCVSNRGLAIQNREINEIKGRRKQGVAAKGHSGGGSGLGLYIVDNIMRAHGGRLDIRPTREKDQVTEIRLVFDPNLG